MWRRLILSAAILGLVAVPASSSANVQARLATVGLAEVSYYGGCFDTFDVCVSFQLTGTWVSHGRVYLGVLEGATTASPAEYLTPGHMQPFTLSGTGPDGRSASFACDGTDLDRGDDRIRLTCRGSINGGPIGERTIRIVGVNRQTACSCYQSTTTGFYIGVA